MRILRFPPQDSVLADFEPPFGRESPIRWNALDGFVVGVVFFRVGIVPATE